MPAIIRMSGPHWAISAGNEGTSYIVPVKRENEKLLSFIKTII
jgi:hypothetical protein